MPSTPAVNDVRQALLGAIKGQAELASQYPASAATQGYPQAALDLSTALAQLVTAGVA